MRYYQQLEAIFKRIATFEEIGAILSWDKEVMMPLGSIHKRAEHLSLIAEEIHNQINDPKVQELIKEVDLTNLSEIQKANFREIKRLVQMETSLPKDLKLAFVKAITNCEMNWREARQNNDYKAILPYLSEVIKLVKEIAVTRSEIFGISLYDALIHEFDPYRKSEAIDPIFKRLKEFLPGFITQVIETQSKIKLISLDENYPVAAQKELGMFCMDKLGFDFNLGRLDISTHPFCGGLKDDARITTRYQTNEFATSLMGVLHETGHAMYGQNLPKTLQPVYDALGMSIHESQSLFVEMQISRTKEFLSWILPFIKEKFGDHPGFTLDNLFNTSSRVNRSLIRVDADEVTYPLHVIIRYELEKEIISGNLQVEDIPLAWNENYEKLLGIKPDSNANGCMQDCHWFGGAFGYFPCYSLGAITAAQLFADAKKRMPDLLNDIKQGDFRRIMDYLKINIHQAASIYSADELIKRVTGSNLDVELYINYLKDKYLEQK